MNFTPSNNFYGGHNGAFDRSAYVNNLRESQLRNRFENYEFEKAAERSKFPPPEVAQRGKAGAKISSENRNFHIVIGR